MLRVALTGGIATGKTYVAAKLRARGIPVLDADALAHGVMAAGTEATAAIAARFGADVLGPDGSVNRAKLGPIVFADPAARRELEAIVHPAVHRATEAGIRAFELTGSYAMAVVDMPLLFETGGQKKFDRVIVTTCRRGDADGAPEGTRVVRGGRAPAPGGPAAADQKTSRADYVIDTIGSFADTDKQIEATLARILGEREANLRFLGFHFGRVLRWRNPLFYERIPVVAMRALPEQLGAAVPAAHADVRIQIEHRVLRQLAVAIHERLWMVQLSSARQIA